MVRHALASLLALSLTLGATPSLAADPPPRPASTGPETSSAARSDLAGLDTVLLKSGTLMRGTVVEYIPERSVTIRSAADGQTLRYAWSEIASTTLAPPVNAPRIFGRADAPLLHVELSTPADVHLHEVLTPDPTPRRSPGGYQVESSRYRIRCVAPCDTVIDAHRGQRFFFAGEGVPRSRPFALSGLGPNVHARVRVGSTARLTGGLIGTPLGAAGLVIGGVLVGDPRARGPGVVALALGTALLAGGIALLLTGRTRLELTRAAPRGRRAPGSAAPAPITLR